MIVTINIQGAGIVNGGGGYNSGDRVSLEAIPSTVMKFKHFLIGGESVLGNPYEITAGENDITVTAVFYMTIEESLKNKIGYPVTSEQVYSILTDRNIPIGVDASTVSRRDKDLAYADLIMLIATTSSEGATEEQMGNWKTKKGSRSLTGKNELIKMAKAIYSKYGINLTSSIVRDKTKLW